MEDKLSVIIVDDDPVQIELVSSFVNKTNFLHLEQSYTDPLEALENIANATPDLLIVDVEMPELTGFELLKTLQNPPKTIVITGKAEYAVEAFELNVVDYLVKPVDSYPRFLRAVNKLKGTTSKSVKLKKNESLFVKEEGLLVKLSLSEISYFEAYGDYVKVGTSNKVHIVHSTLAKIESRLPDEFIKVHRSFVVRLESIVNIDHTNIQVGDKIIPVSKSMKSSLMERITTL